MSVIHLIRRDSFLEQLLARVPEVEQLLVRDDLDKRDAAAIAYRVSRALFDVRDAPPVSGWSPSRDSIKRFLRFIDDVATSGAPDLKDAVRAVSGLLVWNQAAHDSVRDLLGPALRREIREYLEQDRGLLKMFVPFLRRIADEVPGSARVIDQALETWDGEIYSTFVLERLTDFVFAAKRRILADVATRTEAEIVARWLAIAENAMAEPRLAELLNQTFVESVAHSDISEGFRNQLPDHLAEAVDRWKRL